MQALWVQGAQSPSPTPSAVPPTTDGSATSDSGSTLIEFANLAIQFSTAVLAMMATILAIAAFFGLSQARVARERSEELKRAIESTQEMRTLLDARINALEGEIESLALVAHYFNEGEDAYKSGEYDLAISFFEQALELQPENGRMQVRIARALINKGLNSRAQRYLRRATTRSPDDAQAWRAWATSVRFTNPAEALEYMERAIDLDPSDSDSWNYLGLLHRDGGEYEEAVYAHQEAARLNPTEPTTDFFIGLLQVQLGRLPHGSHSLWEAHSKAEVLRSTNRIRPIWAKTIEWAYRYDRNTHGDEQASVELGRELADLCGQPRNRRAVLSHMIFLLRAKGIDPKTDDSLSAFPTTEVESLESSHQQVGDSQNE